MAPAPVPEELVVVVVVIEVLIVFWIVAEEGARVTVVTAKSPSFEPEPKPVPGLTVTRRAVDTRITPSAGGTGTAAGVSDSFSSRAGERERERGFFMGAAPGAVEVEAEAGAVEVDGESDRGWRPPTSRSGDTARDSEDA